MIMAHLLHVSKHNALYFTKDQTYAQALRLSSFNSSFLSPEFSVSCSTVLFIEILTDGLFHAQKKNNRWILTHTLAFSPAIFESFHQIIEQKHNLLPISPRFARSIVPTFSPPPQQLIFVAKFPQSPQSPHIQPGVPPSGKPTTSALDKMTFRRCG